MNIVTILNQLHKRGNYDLLSNISRIMYFIKGAGVTVRYHEPFRAYEFRTKGISYMSLGPGWAYSFEYLKNLLVKTYCHFYLPKRDDCVIDIGAGLGEESLIIAQLIGSGGKLFSIEANPITYKALEYACLKNNFSWVKPLNVALYEKDQIVNIEDDDQSYIGNTIKTSESVNSYKVRGVTLDTLVAENDIGQIDFLKLNIEGAEQFLMKGSDKAMKKVKHACISCHDFRQVHHNHGEFYVTKERIKAFLIAKGFDVSMRNTGDVVIDDFIYAKSRGV